jgi:hypothetical protein
VPGNPQLLSILPNQPADEDQRDFNPYAKTLADIAADPGTDAPLTIGVFDRTPCPQRRHYAREAAHLFSVGPVDFAWPSPLQPLDIDLEGILAVLREG